MINACIVETHYRAGVYEDKDLLQYNPYVKNAKIEEFPSFEHALAEFERRYVIIPGLRPTPAAVQRSLTAHQLI